MHAASRRASGERCTAWRAAATRGNGNRRGQRDGPSRAAMAPRGGSPRWLVMRPECGQLWPTSARPRVRLHAPSATTSRSLGMVIPSSREKQLENTLCMDFKAFKTTTQLIQSPNHLHYSKEGTLGYQQELKNDTTPKLNFYRINYQT